MLVCQICQQDFRRQGTRGPIPKFCSARCKGIRDRARPGRKEYERLYRRAERASGKRRLYEFNYNRSPSVRERNRMRMFIKWHTDPEWRESERARMRRTIHPEIVVAAPYTGHRWLDMARQAVLGYRDLDSSTPWADDYHDDMGEAVLALLEGRDMKEAIKEYRRKEYVPRRLTHHMGDYYDEDGVDRWFDKQMPTVPSAEDEAIAREEVIFYEKTRFNNVSTKNRQMKNKQSQPSNRRMNNR